MRLWPRKLVYVDELPKTHDLRFAALFIVMLVVLLGGLYAVGFFVAGDRLARSASVAGVDIGGMREDEAEAKLHDELVPRLAKPIKATAAGKTFTIEPESTGISLDIDATVRTGLGDSRWDPRHMLDVALGGQSIDPIFDVDEAKLARLFTRIEEAVNQKAVNASVIFSSGGPTLTAGRYGAVLDTAAAEQSIREAMIAGDEEARLPMDAVRPDVTAVDARVFADSIATPAVARPIRIKIADTVRTIPPKAFAPALRATVDDGALALTADAQQLRRRTGSVLASLAHQPSNARIEFRDGRPVVVAGASGKSVTTDDWAAAVLRAAQSRGADRTTRVRVVPAPPTFSTADARRLRIHERLAAVTLPLASADAVDARRAAARLDGTLVRPNTDFSLIREVGAADDAAVSVIASAVYDAAFHAGMGHIARSAPRTSVLGSEPGLDASVHPDVDLAWVNETPYGVYVRATTTIGRGRPSVTVSLWGHRYWTVHVTTSGRYNVVPHHTVRDSGGACRARRGVSGFDVDVGRRITRPGEQARMERTHSHYEPLDAVVCH